MKKRFASILFAVTMIISSFSSFAGQWINNGNWYYLDDNGNYLKSQWVGNYYLGADGVMMTNSWTPDGYYVGADGAWNGQPAITPSNIGLYSTASQQASIEEMWSGKYYVSNRTEIYFWNSEGVGVDYLYADNNSVKVKGYFEKLDYNEDFQYIGYHDKTFMFSNNCSFWGCGGDGEDSPYSRSEFIQILNNHNGLGFNFTVENDVIVRAELWS